MSDKPNEWKIEGLPTGEEFKEAFLVDQFIDSPEEACGVDPNDAPISAYANQSVLGLQAGLVQGRRYDYQDEHRRQNALSFALEYTRADRKMTADGVVEVAKTFHAFLKGEANG